MSGKNNTLARGTACVCLAVCLLLGTGCGKQNGPEPTEEVTVPTEIVEIPTETQPKELSVTELMQAVLALKDDLETVLDSMKEEDLQQAESLLDGIGRNTQMVRASLNATIQNLGDSAPSIQKKLEEIQKILNLVDLVSEKLLVPAIGQLKAYPTSEIRVNDGMNTRWLVRYLDFLETLIPDFENILAYAQDVDLSLVDEDGEISAYLKTADELLEIYRADESVLTWLKTVLGANGDRVYLIAPQNSAEIRASGGFPGAMGTIRIKDGVLTLGRFRPVYDVLTIGVPRGVRLTVEEQRLFSNYLSGMNAPRDADLCPDFERVAGIWAAGYEQENKEALSGIISMTPHLMQRVLEALDSEIQLIDGRTLNGENATKVLQYDIYMSYYGRATFEQGVHPEDLFNEAAQKTMAAMIDGMSASNIIRYLSVAKTSLEDRTLMFWMNDEAEQETVLNMDWGGSLNKDPEKPQAGVYFNCTLSSKMGIFLVMDTEMGERTQNGDGSYSYPITVTFSNCMTSQEWKNASQYITGGKDGIQGAAYFFAPAGGTVSDFQVNGLTVRRETYGELELGFLAWMMVRRDKPITVTYTVTTAPGGEMPLEFSKTPTLQGLIK